MKKSLPPYTEWFAKKKERFSYFLHRFLSFFSIVSIFFAFYANASPNFTSENYFQGLYIGGGLGANLGSTTIKADMIPFNKQNPASFLQEFHGTLSGQKNSAAGALFLGGGYVKRRFYFGGELGTDIANRDFYTDANQNKFLFFPPGGERVLNEAVTFSQQTQGQTFAFYTDALIGAILTPKTLFFLRAGATYNTFHFTAQFATSDQFPGLTDLSQVQISTSSLLVGVRLGFGMTAALKRNFLLRLEYINSYYPKNMSFEKTVLLKNPDAVGNAISNKATVSSLCASEFYLSSIYRFYS